MITRSKEQIPNRVQLMQRPTLSELPAAPPDKTDWPWTEESPPPLPTTWPRVSIVMPTYNSGQVTEMAVRSVLLQDYPNLEYLIIDGGSSDETMNILHKYEPWLAYWVSEPDRGVYHAMNKGLEAATGDILFFLGADDCLCDEQVVADVVSVFNQKPDLDIIYGNLVWDWSGEMVRQKQPKTITREFLARTTILHQTIFAKKEVFAASGGFSENYNVISDYEWMLKVFLRDGWNYHYYDRDIAVGGTQGLSWITKWEHEKIDVMRQYFGLYEILRFRILPMKKRSIMNVLRHLKQTLVKGH